MTMNVPINDWGCDVEICISEIRDINVMMYLCLETVTNSKWWYNADDAYVMFLVDLEPQWSRRTVKAQLECSTAGCFVPLAPGSWSFWESWASWQSSCNTSWHSRSPKWQALLKRTHHIKSTDLVSTKERGPQIPRRSWNQSPCCFAVRHLVFLNNFSKRISSSFKMGSHKQKQGTLGVVRVTVAV